MRLPLGRWRSGEFQGRHLVDFRLRRDDSCQRDRPTLLGDEGRVKTALVGVDRPPVRPRARAGATATTEQAQRELANALVDALAEALIDEATVGSFLAWTKIAQVAARLGSVADVIAADPALAGRHAEFSFNAEERFTNWLPAHYRSLASLALPDPHHLYHLPGFLAFQRRRRASGRVAIIVLDGMSMADWVVIGDRWRANHPEWRMAERALLAQIPTITSISRHALFSGLRPIDFPDSLDTTVREPARWQNFWIREGLPAERAQFRRLSTNEPLALPSTGSATIAIVETSIDDLVHATKMGDVQLRVDCNIWLNNRSRRVETTIDELTSHGFAV